MFHGNAVGNIAGASPAQAAPQAAAEFPEKLQALFRPKRFKVLYGGRGAGRSWGIARALLIMGAQRPIRVLCAREFQNSITESVHKVLSDQIENLGLAGFYEIQQTKIIGANGTTFSFEGVKNNTTRIKSYEGIDYCWVEEAVKVSRQSWGILIPTIRKNGSEIWMSFNPELDTDYTYKRFVVSRDEDAVATGDGCWESARACVVKMTYRDNPFFPAELVDEMEADKKRDHDYYLNVWEGHTLQMLDGVVYAKELRRVTEDGRVCAVPYDKTVPVNTYWDLGRADNTAIWFGQRVAMQWRALAYFEDRGEDISYFIRELQRRPYVYGTCFLPHDAAAKRLGSKLTIEEQLKAAGYRTYVIPRQSITDGINAARLFMGNVWFDEEKCADGLNALRHYRYKVLEAPAVNGRQQLGNEPLHDWASDGADAFRYMALASTRGGDTGLAVKVRENLERAKASISGQFGKHLNDGLKGQGWLK